MTSKKTPTPETKKEIVKKEKLDAIPLPNKTNEKLSVEEEKKQKPSKDLTEDENLKEIIKPKKPKIIITFSVLEFYNISLMVIVHLIFYLVF